MDLHVSISGMWKLRFMENKKCVALPLELCVDGKATAQLSKIKPVSKQETEPVWSIPFTRFANAICYYPWWTKKPM